jgi:hypothetical protein
LASIKVLSFMRFESLAKVKQASDDILIPYKTLIKHGHVNRRARISLESDGQAGGEIPLRL